MQVQNPPGSESFKDCPFCLTSSFGVEFKGPKTAEEIAREKAEQDKVEKLHKAVRDEEIRRDSLRVLQTKAKPVAEEMFQEKMFEENMFEVKESENKEDEEEDVFEIMEDRDDGNVERSQRINMEQEQDDENSTNSMSQEGPILANNIIVPSSVEDEEEQLRAAILMSLQEN